MTDDFRKALANLLRVDPTRIYDVDDRSYYWSSPGSDYSTRIPDRIVQDAKLLVKNATTRRTEEFRHYLSGMLGVSPESLTEVGNEWHYSQGGTTYKLLVESPDATTRRTGQLSESQLHEVYSEIGSGASRQAILRIGGEGDKNQATVTATRRGPVVQIREESRTHVKSILLDRASIEKILELFNE